MTGTRTVNGTLAVKWMNWPNRSRSSSNSIL